MYTLRAVEFLQSWSFNHFEKFNICWFWVCCVCVCAYISTYFSQPANRHVDGS